MPIMGCWCDNRPCTCGETALRVSRNLDRPALTPIRAAEMVERVAEAIFLKEGRAQDVAWADADKVLALTPQRWGNREKPPLVSDYYRAIARAAITAMREPTEAMADAPWKAEIIAGETCEGPVYIQSNAAHDAWRSMLDEALK